MSTSATTFLFVGNEEPRPSELEPTGETVAANVVRVRRLRELTLRALSERLAELGHPMSTSAINRIENRSRKVDSDDLMALAVALDVSPLGLLLPVDADLSDQVEITGWSADAEALWMWVLELNRTDPPGIGLPPWLRVAPTVHVVTQRALALREEWEQRNG